IDTAKFNGLWDVMNWNLYWRIINLRDMFAARDEINERIDDNSLKPCMKTVLNELIGLKAAPGSILMRFDSQIGQTSFDWKVVDGALAPHINAITSSVLTNGYATTVFDSKKQVNATELSVARTILHESVHAFLVIEFRTTPGAFAKKYGELMKDYNTTKRGFNQLQHEEFTRQFIKYIGGALESYGLSKGYNYSRQFYNDLAWGGLEDTDAFQNLSSSERRRISDNVQIEHNGKDRNGNSRPQKGTRSSCR
ncbi:MAG: hypothetical protein AAGH46_13845, partial [Bacteroidota bacterium]